MFTLRRTPRHSHTKSRLSVRPSTLIATLALFLACGGTSYAIGGTLNGALLKDGSVAGVKLKKHTITGTYVNVLTFPTVPSAHVADSATTAATATNATKAGTVTGTINGGQVSGAVADATHATSATGATNASHATAADTLTTLPSGQSESGAFSGGGGSSPSDYYGLGITYARPLATAIADGHIIDTRVTADPAHCPGPGKAAAGYLCLYFHLHNQTGAVYGYSTEFPYSAISPSVGVGLYAPIVGPDSFVDGVWTVTAP